MTKKQIELIGLVVGLVLALVIGYLIFSSGDGGRNFETPIELTNQEKMEILEESLGLRVDSDELESDTKIELLDDAILNSTDILTDEEKLLILNK